MALESSSSSSSSCTSATGGNGYGNQTGPLSASLGGPPLPQVPDSETPIEQHYSSAEYVKRNKRLLDGGLTPAGKVSKKAKKTPTSAQQKLLSSVARADAKARGLSVNLLQVSGKLVECQPILSIWLL